MVHRFLKAMMEIQRTAKRIESLPVDGVFSSPLGRAISAAQTYAYALDQTITAVDDLRELDRGDMAGMTNEKIERAFPGELARRSRDKYQWRFPNGESYADADLRAASALRQVAESGRSRPLVVTHEMIARMLLRNLLALEPNEALTLGSSTASSIGFTWSPRRSLRSIRAFNDGRLLGVRDRRLSGERSAPC
jgi:broad specificity phosphatase PhoE